MLRPLLFILYLNELIEMLKGLGVHFQVSGTCFIVTTLFADNIALYADTPGHLQLVLDTLSSFCRK